MVGDIVKIGGIEYIKINDHGTLQRLPHIPWYRTLQIWVMYCIRSRSVGFVTDFYDRHRA